MAFARAVFEALPPTPTKACGPNVS